MKKLLLILPLLLLPTTAFAAVTAVWVASSTTQGWVFPNRMNGTEQTVISQNFIATSTSLSSRFPYASTTALTVSGALYNVLANGCMQISSNLVTSTGASCGSGGGSTNTDKWATSTDNISIYPNTAQKIGIGTTTPNWTLQISSSSPVLALSDIMSPVNSRHWLFGNYDGKLQWGTSTDDLTATSAIMTLDVAGDLGIGTTTPGRINGVDHTVAVLGGFYAHSSQNGSMFRGRQGGVGYSSSNAIFDAISDNPTGSSNFFMKGAAGGVLTYSVRADGLVSAVNYLASASSTFQNFTGINATTTSATSTSFFATTASTTNFFGAGLATCNSASNALTWNAGMFGCNTITGGGGGTWATSSNDYYASQFRDWSLQGSPVYLAPTTSQAILVNNATSTITNLTSVNSTSTAATSTNLYTSGQTILAALAGKVGIATTSPAQPLSVSGAGYFTSTGNGTKFQVDNTGGNGSQIPYLFEADNNFSTAFCRGLGAASSGCAKLTVTSSGALSVASDNTISLSPNNAQALIAHTNGNVGIGSMAGNTLVNKFTVAGNTAIGSSYTTTAAPADGLIVQGGVGIGSTTPGTALGVTGSGGFTGLVYAPNFLATSTTATSTIQGVLSVDQGSNILPGNAWFRVGSSTSNIIVDKFSGNTGIGTSSPYALLSVYNNTLPTSFAVGSTSSTTFAVTNTGRVGIGTADPQGTLHIFNNSTMGGSPSIIIGGNNGGDTDFNISRFNTNDATNNDSLRFGTSTVPGTNTFFTMDYTGFIGVGTTSPFATLSVTGPTYVGNNFTATGTINFPAIATGCVISTNGTITSNGVSCSTWATSSDDYYQSQFATWKVDPSGALTPTTTRSILITASTTLQNFTSLQSTSTNATTTNSFAGTASSTNQFGANLNTCNSASSALTWSAGKFGCNTISSGGGGNSKWSTSTTNTNAIITNGVNAVVGIGTTTPYGTYQAQIATSTGQNLVLSNGSVNPQWAFRVLNDGSLAVSTSSASTGATSTVPSIQVKSTTATRLGVATATPWATFSVTGNVAMDGLTAAAGTVQGVCLVTASKELVANSGANCTTSSRRWKHDILDLDSSATGELMAFKPSSFFYNDSSSIKRIGFVAEDIAAVNPALADYDAQGLPSSIDTTGILSVTVKALQESNKRIDGLERQTMLAEILAFIAVAIAITTTIRCRRKS